MVEGEKREREKEENNRDTGANTGTQTPSGFYIHALYCPTSPCPPSNNTQYALKCTSKTNWYEKKEHTKSNLQSKSTPLHFYFCCGAISL